MLATGVTVGLAEWIIDDIYFVYFVVSTCLSRIIKVQQMNALWSLINKLKLRKNRDCTS